MILRRCFIGRIDAICRACKRALDIAVTHRGRIADADDGRIAVTSRLPILGEGGAPEYLLTVIQDVTEKKTAEARIARLAHYDSLTDLPNRAAFNQCFASVLERAANSDESFAVLCLDLDRFNEINDVFGHSTGDRLLRATAERWSATLQGAFPDGVCDFSKPGVGFQPNVPWLDYTNGPGGQPLGSPPATLPLV